MKTLVIYQDITAHQDILDWGKRMNIDLPKNNIRWKLKRKRNKRFEEIKIIPKSLIRYSHLFYDKLVLIGSFNKSDLKLIINVVNIR